MVFSATFKKYNDDFHTRLCCAFAGDGSWHAWYAGWAEGVVMPRPGEFHDENFASMDYAIYRAGQLGE
jgi:hypothetical protein